VVSFKVDCSDRSNIPRKEVDLPLRISEHRSHLDFAQERKVQKQEVVLPQGTSYLNLHGSAPDSRISLNVRDRAKTSFLTEDKDLLFAEEEEKQEQQQVSNSEWVT
jgi:hypothetical protein